MNNFAPITLRSFSIDAAVYALAILEGKYAFSLPLTSPPILLRTRTCVAFFQTK